MPSFPLNPVKLASKGVGTAFQIGSFVAGQAYERVQSLIGGSNGHEARYAPATPPASPAEAPAPTPPAATLAAVPQAKPTTAKTTATGPGGRGRTAPPAPKKPAARKPATRSAGARISNPKAAKKVRARTAKAEKASAELDRKEPAGGDAG